MCIYTCYCEQIKIYFLFMPSSHNQKIILLKLNIYFQPIAIDLIPDLITAHTSYKN